MKYKAGFIGCGNMGGALARAAASAVGGNNVALFDVDGAKSAALAGALGAGATDDADVYKNSE
ncbi:MAG: NAD(P)-binding domain-containing protein, partial [Clostridia bacterium]|nr:NAD(P)-binding domain-containing protein [Clostridia bacterium]